MQAIVDCNSFYCSCERLFQPQLKQAPVVVLSNNDGCIVSRSDEAKRLGISMAVPYFQAKEIIEKNKKGIESSDAWKWDGAILVRPKILLVTKDLILDIFAFQQNHQRVFDIISQEEVARIIEGGFNDPAGEHTAFE